jgi:hypothetical protein
LHKTGISFFMTVSLSCTISGCQAYMRLCNISVILAIDRS